MKKYLAYKQSNIDWIGEIPEHWETLPNKAIFSLKKKQVGKKAYEYTLLSLTLNGVIKRDMENPQGKFPAEFDTYQEVKQGDFIFCFFDVEETPRAVGLSNFDGMITGAYTVLEANPNFDKGFLYYFYLNLDENKMLKPLYRGLRNTVPKESFFAFKTLIPPLHEQRAIAEFLDQKTAQIDKAIDLKKRQIALLKERRQGIIHEAVTGKGKGNEGMKNEGMKDSGVEWIGEIPKHWEVNQLRRVADTTSGSTPPSGNLSRYYNGNIPWVRTTDLNDDILFDVPEKITDLALKETSCKIVPKNTICVAMYGGAGTIGKHSILTFEATVNQAVCAVIPSEMIVPYYLYYYIKFYRPHWMITAKGSRVDPNISQNEVRKMPIALPPLSEQAEIVSYIESQNEKINRAIGIKEQEIEKLKEYKAVLIDSAVTGKVRVMKE